MDPIKTPCDNLFEARPYLIFTSLLYSIPCIYAYYISEYYHSFICFLTILFSVNYWRYPIAGLRRTIDICMATFSVIYTLYHIFMYITPPISYLCYYFNAIGILLFNFSCKLHEYGYSYWYKMHIFMHIFILCSVVLSMHELYGSIY